MRCAVGAALGVPVGSVRARTGRASTETRPYGIRIMWLDAEKTWMDRFVGDGLPHVPYGRVQRRYGAGGSGEPPLRDAKASKKPGAGSAGLVRMISGDAAISGGHGEGRIMPAHGKID